MEDSGNASAPSFVVNGFGAFHGGIVRVHNEVCRELAKIGAVDVVNAPRRQVEDGSALRVLTRQGESRWRSFLTDASRGLRRRDRKHYVLRVDSAPAFGLLLRATRRVVIVHDLGFAGSRRSELSRLQVVYRTFLHRTALSRCDLLIANSEQTKREIAAYRPEYGMKTIVLPLPVDHILGGDKNSINKRTSGLNALQLLTFGHSENKRIDLILELLKVRRDCRLTVICPVDDWERLWAPLAQTLDVSDRVTVKSNVADRDIVDLYHATDVFLMVSDYEGYGIPVAEALSLGCRVVISDLDVLRETSRGFGVVCKARTVEALSIAVDEACALPFSQLSSARSLFSAWTWEKWVSSLLGHVKALS